MGFPGGAIRKESTIQSRRHKGHDLIPESGSSPGGANDNPHQYFAWRIQWTEEPGGLQSTGSQRVRRDLRDLT